MKGKNKNIILCIFIIGIIIVTMIIFCFFYVLVSNTSGKNVQNHNCSFVRTYKIEYILPSNNEEYLYLTIRAFQDEDVQTIKVLKSLSPQIEQGKYYEFTFEVSEKIKKDTILSIYQGSTITSIIETSKLGLEQRQEALCVPR